MENDSGFNLAGIQFPNGEVTRQSARPRLIHTNTAYTTNDGSVVPRGCSFGIAAVDEPPRARRHPVQPNLAIAIRHIGGTCCRYSLQIPLQKLMGLRNLRHRVT